jgi:hypothetical protein
MAKQPAKTILCLSEQETPEEICALGYSTAFDVDDSRARNAEFIVHVRSRKGAERNGGPANQAFLITGCTHTTPDPNFGKKRVHICDPRPVDFPMPKRKRGAQRSSWYISRAEYDQLVSANPSLPTS